MQRWASDVVDSGAEAAHVIASAIARVLEI
jgi:hypothetical protein